jgi:Domain of Unknown Function (DUF1080)
MNRMLGRSLVAAATTLTALAAGAADGWQPLFNGRDLTGWVPVNDGVYYATNGVIHLEKGKGWLRTERPYTNFVLEAEGRGLLTNYNSGFFVRAPLAGKPWATNIWQVNTKQSAIGQLLEGSREAQASATPAVPEGQWVKFHLEVSGKTMTLDVDGKRAWSFEAFTPESGYLGLQAEGRPFEFRNLQVRELPAKDGK